MDSNLQACTQEGHNTRSPKEEVKEGGEGAARHCWCYYGTNPSEEGPKARNPCRIEGGRFEVSALI